MSAIARTYTFVDGTDAFGSQVESEFDTIYDAWNNHDAGTSKWTVISVLNASAVPLIADNSTGTNDIVNFKDNGTTVFKIADSGAATVTAINGTAVVPLTVNNGTSTGSIFLAQDNGTQMFLIADGGNTAVGNVVPDGKLHVHTATAGTVTANAAADDLVVEGSTTSGISILTPNTNDCNIFFGDPDDNNVGGITYEHSTNNMLITRNGVTTITIGSPTIFGVDIVADAAASINIGSASAYVNDVSYKTLTDRGCLGWFDDGVELQDGRIVSDIEAIMEIQKDDAKQTVYGVPMLKYKTFPKACYKRADVKGVLLPRDVNDEPIGGVDGIEMTSLFSIMLGALKELQVRLSVLEAK